MGSQNGQGGKTITPTSKDPYLIIRIENVTVEDKISAIVEKTKEEVFELDFSSVEKNECPVGEAAFNNEKTDYGRFGNNNIYYKDGKVDITWNGNTATVNGTLKNVKSNDAEKITSDGHYFAFALIDWFKGKQITVTTSKANTVTDTDCVCKVTEDSKVITVEYNGSLIARFDLSKATLEQ